MNSTIESMIKILMLGTLSFLFTLIITPGMTAFMYKNELWKNRAREKSIDGKELKVFTKFHSEKEVNVPRLGGLLVWIPPLILTFLFYGLTFLTDRYWVRNLNFLTRNETWLPLFALVVAALVGLFDDLLQVLDEPKSRFLKFMFRKTDRYVGGGLSLMYRIGATVAIGMVGGWWFYSKLEVSEIMIPFFGYFDLGIFFVPFFILVMLATYSGSVIDGLDGLSGGAFAAIFAAFTFIAVEAGMMHLASFSMVLVGSILAFLWFNIPPARFYMGETGIFALTATLTVVAFLTDSVLVLPIIGILLVAESASVIIQLISKKFLGRKFFKAAPIHHHFEDLGWPSHKVTMRFWIIGAMAAILGVIIRVMG